MIKIKCGLFEFILIVTFFSEITAFFEIFVIVDCMRHNYYRILLVSFGVCFIIFYIFLMIFFFILSYDNDKDNYLIFDSSKDFFKFKKKEFKISDIEFVEYVKCRWYHYPYAMLLLPPVGSIKIVTKDNRRLFEYISYREYLKLKRIGLNFKIINIFK